MSVARLDLNKCVGCRNCVKLCPMDVFYFDEEANKSVMASPRTARAAPSATCTAWETPSP